MDQNGADRHISSPSCFGRSCMFFAAWAMFSYLFTTELLAKLHLQVEHRLKGGWLFQTHDILETSDPVVCPVGMGTFLQPTTIFGDAIDSHSLSHVCTGF